LVIEIIYIVNSHNLHAKYSSHAVTKLRVLLLLVIYLRGSTFSIPRCNSMQPSSVSLEYIDL